MYAITTIHSTGINWGQAFATWVPIVLGMLTVGRLISKWLSKRRDEAQKYAREIADQTIRTFAEALNIKFTEIQKHLGDQDKRFDRIDRTMDINSE